jgi:hypothetical protein
VVRAGRRASGQQHESQKAGHFCVVATELMDESGEPHRFVRKIVPLEIRSDTARVALVEDQ